MHDTEHQYWETKIGFCVIEAAPTMAEGKQANKQSFYNEAAAAQQRAWRTLTTF